MRRLRPTDGTSVHRRAAVYHMAMCRKGTTPLHGALYLEMKERYDLLKLRSREKEDGEDADVEAMADADLAEATLENLIRDLDAALATIDRRDPTVNAQKTVFPEGFGQVIDPEGSAQRDILPAFKVRLGAFQNHPEVALQLPKLDVVEASFAAALAAVEATSTKVDVLFAEERVARQEIRIQLESAYGRLRDLYKTRPGLVEAFFLNEGGSRRPKKEEEAPKEPAAPVKAQPAG